MMNIMSKTIRRVRFARRDIDITSFIVWPAPYQRTSLTIIMVKFGAGPRALPLKELTSWLLETVVTVVFDILIDLIDRIV
jgi:hypothetical protein